MQKIFEVGTGKSEGKEVNDNSGRRISGIGIGINSGISLALQSRNATVISGRSREELRRHTLSGDHQSLHHQQCGTMPASNTIGVTSTAAQSIHPLHPRHLPPPHSQYGASSRQTAMDLEMGTKSRQKKLPIPRGYPPPSSAMLFDDDPGIMSEVETSSTGFRRGGKQRSSLPVVRTPSKTLERPLGLVFLQYRNETKRALLPNEITSIDTVKALFVRSFPKQLTMEYLDSPHVKIYIHDSNKDMFYELEDLRSHLRDIRDRTVLRLFESDGIVGMPGTLGVPGGNMLPSHWEDQSYFSEPEFDSEFQHQHIHKSKNTKNSNSGSGYYLSGSSTLPRSGALIHSYSPAAIVLPGSSSVVASGQSKSVGNSDRSHGETGYTSSPERGGGVGISTASVGSTGSSTGPGSTTSSRYPPGSFSAGSSYEDPYYSQYSGTVTPVIDEEASSDMDLLEESYSLYGVKLSGRQSTGHPHSPFAATGSTLLSTGQPYDTTRIRVEHMERQLANLTGLVQKALTHAPHPPTSARDYLQVPIGRDTFAKSTDDTYLRTDAKPPKLGKDKSVSFEKSVSFSDEPPDMNSPKQHSPQHTADSKPTKPAIKSSTLPRMSSQEKERNKPTPPPKPVALATGQFVYRDLSLTPEMYNQLRGMQKKAKDLRQEIKNLRRMSQAQAHTVRETIRDAFVSIRTILLSSREQDWSSSDAEKLRLSRDEDLYKQEMLWLEKDLTGLESTVEELRGNVINRKTRVNMSDVENMALILSKASKTVADLKVRFPNLQEGMKGLLSSEMEKVMREEKFLKEEPDRLESALKRCKKLTGTLVTLKRLASVQEQRLPNSGSVDTEEISPITPATGQQSKQTTTPVPADRFALDSTLISGGSHESTESSHCTSSHSQRPENALDALLDELQTFSRPTSSLSQVSCTSMQQQIITLHLAEIGRPESDTFTKFGGSTGRTPTIAEIGRKGSIDSSCLLQPNVNQSGTLLRLHSYPSSSDTDTYPPVGLKFTTTTGQEEETEHETNSQLLTKPPVPERNAELLQMVSVRRIPPPPPPRTSSRSPLASPTSPQLPPRNPCVVGLPATTLRRIQAPPLIKAFSENNYKLPVDFHCPEPNNIISASNSSSFESVNSQEGLQIKKERQEQLDQRHQELLRKQKALQEQYTRLQQLQRNASGCSASVPPSSPDLLKKTGSESNLLAKMGLGLSTATTSGSLTSLSNAQPISQSILLLPRDSSRITEIGSVMTNTEAAALLITNSNGNDGTSSVTTTSKVYETDIL
ncbi:coiled-coil domain-containing protein AGAP005037 isoform X7 [Nasonia vitripennis]|uniref:Actin interacting protein 3-like C-terminal domain-containing protein n=1 Tax=Nasonia vitripennis TaxID=7425 RepID=A0A7M7PTT1_NASVI|nr:coiled-coil domain-containing protein AGAP005037 isoform X7 [Nasonia vitripennis]XP_032457229.1 coiled-coil domain-containing protein AGAP005037 isoform X7 [Nasonia vitripennis]